MSVEYPILKGNVIKNCDPEGIAQRIKLDYQRAELNPELNFKNVLILGGGSGYGLATRMVLAKNGANTINVCFERKPGEGKLGSAGYYNVKTFEDIAEGNHQTFFGDAFSYEMKQSVNNYAKEHGPFDLVVYSLATGIRPKGENLVRSVIKPIGDLVTGFNLNFETESLEEVTLDPATEQEIEDTQYVMGGGDLEEWIYYLKANNKLTEDVKVLSFSYIGSELNADLYHNGTLGSAKSDLKWHNDLIRENYGIDTRVVVAKAVVTKASAYIPNFGLYVMALYKVMKECRVHEDVLDQMNRLFCSNKLDSFDEEGYIRIDDLELNSIVQQQVEDLMKKTTPSNFKWVLDYEGVKEEFLGLNGF